MLDFEGGEREPFDHSNSKKPIIYIGRKYGQLVQMDMKQFCPDVGLIQRPSIEAAQSDVETIELKTIILDDGPRPESVVAFLTWLRNGNSINCETPVRILSLQPPAWVEEILARFDNVLTIPGDEGSPSPDPFRVD